MWSPARRWPYCSVASETTTPAARLLVRGGARARRYMPPPAVLAGIAWRYYGHPRFAMVELQHMRLWTRRMRYYKQAQAAHIVITPETATECRVPPP